MLDDSTAPAATGPRDQALIVARHLRESVRRRGEWERAGAFLAGFDPRSDNPYRNWATPDETGQPGPADVAALVAAFERRSRTPRLEYVPATAPDLEATLRAAGFRTHQRTAVLFCRPGDALPVAPPAGIVLVSAASETDLRRVAEVQHEAYGEPAPPGPADVERLAATVRAGGVVVLARDDASGAPVGAGLVTAPIDGLGELAAVATAAAWRRRGVATAVSARLIALAGEAGASLVYLEPEGPAEQRIYERVGFRVGTEKLALIR